MEGADILEVLQTTKIRDLKPHENIWSQEDHLNFVYAVYKYGKDYKKITNYLGNKTKRAVANYGHRYAKRLELKSGSEEAKLLKILKPKK